MSFLSFGRRALAAVALLAAAGAAHASSFAYTSTAGEPIGNGVGTRTLASPNATFTVYNYDDSFFMVDVDQAGEHWNIQFRAPRFWGTNSPLHRGSFNNAEHAALATPRAPGLEINGPHGNCLDAYGSFKIRQLEYDVDGHVAVLEATFTHRCGSTTAPVLTGTLYFEAKPRSFAYTRGATTPIGTGTAKTYYGDTSYIGAGGFNSLLVFNVQGQRDTWHFVAEAPEGQEFIKGRTYPLASAPDATHAAMYIEWNDLGVCAAPTGTIKVLNYSTFPDMGELNGLYATFTVYCDGLPDPFKGTIRYKL